MAKYLQNGVRQTVGTFPEDARAENGIAVAAAGGRSIWVLHFWALMRSVRTYAGSVRLFTGSGSRLAAIVAVPGARAFEVMGRAADATSNEQLELEIEGIECRGGPWGVAPIPGNSIAGARSYRVASGVAGAVTVTGDVLGWAARATLAGASVSVVALPALSFGPVAVPQNGEVHGNAERLLSGVSTWTFVNTSGYLIEYVPPGYEFDG